MPKLSENVQQEKSSAETFGCSYAGEKVFMHDVRKFIFTKGNVEKPYESVRQKCKHNRVNDGHLTLTLFSGVIRISFNRLKKIIITFH